MVCYSRIMEGKLVRDGIPDIIRQSGGDPQTHILDQQAYLAALDDKLSEEVAEYLEANDLAELADVLEVIHAIAKARGSSFQAVEEARLKKREERGGFDDQVFLQQ